MNAERRAIVIGGGVSGLSCAHRLLDAGYGVELWSRDEPLATTSSVAAALWYPYHVGPAERTGDWALASLRVFERLAREPASGIRMVPGVELFAGAVEPPGWRSRLEGLAAADDVPAGYGGGYSVRVPVIEMPIYLPWLASRVAGLGGRLERREARSLDEALDEAPLVVNCAGLGARELVPDATLVPIRGQIVRVTGAGVERFVLDEHHAGGVTYVVPRSGDCVLGGTAEEGVESLAPDPDQAAAILARCRALVPGLAAARVVETRVGLRPGRAEVRLELEERGGGRAVVHDYGHGGAGVTLSWGCADEVLGLVRARERTGR